MRTLTAVFRHELASFFYVPLAYVYLVVFAFLASFLTFTLGNFFLLNEASLAYSFFKWHPLLYAFLIPAIGMRAWTQEKMQGTIELLHAQPVALSVVVLGKFLAALALVLFSLLLTLPIYGTVTWLGDPDSGEVAAGYLGSTLLATAFLAISTYFSALMKNQVTVYVVSASLCLLLVLLGSSQFESELLHVFPNSKTLVETISSLSVTRYFSGFRSGLVEFHSIVYFSIITVVSLIASAWVLRSRL